MEPHRSMLTPWRKLQAPHHSNGRKTRSSSLVHTFRPFSSPSPAIRIIARAYDPVLAARGAWGGIFRVDLDASRETGNISLVVLGDADQLRSIISRSRTIRTQSWWQKIVATLLHDQLNKLDSIWAYRLNRENPARNIASRFLALGQDRLARRTRRQRTDRAAHV